MKQLIQFKPIFNTTNQTLDFSAYPNFEITRLYAVINVTQNAPLYIAGAPNLGVTNINGSVLTLAYNTGTHSTTDTLNIYYETEPGYESNTPAESGGNLEKLVALMQDVLIETKVTNFLLQGLYGPINPSMYDYLHQIRNMILDADNEEIHTLG